jgi:hypothetical protein
VKYRVLHLKLVRLHSEIKLATKVCGPRVLRTCLREILICGFTGRTKLTNQILTV